MKKLLTLTLALVVLSAFTGLSAAQEKKPVEPAAIPWADKLTLSATPNVLSKTGCPVTARPGNSKNTAWIYPNQLVDFVVVLGSGPAPASGKTDAKGELKRTVKSGQTVRAEIPMGPNKPPLKSNDFACGETSYPSK